VLRFGIMKSILTLKYLLYTAAILVITLSSCNWIESPDDKVIDINDEFYIGAFESFTPVGRFINLNVTSIEPYKCSDAEINISHIVDGQHLDVTIEGIEEEAPCSGPEKYLSSDVELGQFVNSNYQLNISLGNIVNNSGALIVNDESLILDFDSPKGFICKPTETLRIPENTVWGFASTNENDFNGTLINFVTDLSLLCQPIVMKPGPYSGFSIENSGKLSFDDDSQVMNVHTFYFKFTGNDDDLVALLKEYREDSGTKAEYIVFCTNGRIY
jgi:hypothetical protein